ncbi:MBL fold metallo-hydrolase [Candidatus Bathyarchaeota archaeon]|nr:MBL fold metallo-hydrolase [Candidatus Bathyarchaeota archaeon]NIV68108.1 MBL fold metallo-hydrolase [Candidatus Bathyarchaeota archaeon]NIW16018.1 MBL fold metallo-hydrolase [Candidatus Bathyarchaeota archaeon]
MPTEIEFLGGTREIGRAAIAVRTQKTQMLLDYGVMMGHEPGFPMHVPPNDVDAIVLSHSHLDHSGAIPIFHVRDRKPVYGSPLTFDLTNLLISDFIHLSGYYLPFEYLELRSMMKSSRHLKFREEETLGDMSFQLLDSGHIPGAAQILVEAGDERILYTSDYNTEDTRLLKGADTDYGELDALIIESTYADQEHSNRAELEKEFVAQVTELIEDGGTALIPAFSVGRSQEIACILAAYGFPYSVVMDGMARKVNQITMRHPSYLRDPELFLKAMHAANWIQGWKDRRNAAKEPGAIISPAGMLKGGPSAFYIQKLGKKSRNGVFLVSFQIPGTPGRELLETGKCVIDGKMRKVRARVKHFDFSSHCGAHQLQETVKAMEGNPTVYVVHGAEGNPQAFAQWVREEAGLDAVAPKVGDVHHV